MRKQLDPAQVDAAYRLFYGEGKNLGEITKELGCGIYDLSPWLTAPALRIGREAREDAAERITFLREEIKRLKARTSDWPRAHEQRGGKSIRAREDRHENDT